MGILSNLKCFLKGKHVLDGCLCTTCQRLVHEFEDFTDAEHKCKRCGHVQAHGHEKRYCYGAYSGYTGTCFDEYEVDCCPKCGRELSRTLKGSR